MVSLNAAVTFTKMLQKCLGIFCLDTATQHITNTFFVVILKV